ncbi:Mechanosensitive channel MscK precursor [Rubripirellula lacrimiformis]|uniref:Mechanosensitive channel MscK n=1 Tax=Rubripirellula lacrimiformis TaxID=1930273 RepID=A0A517NKR4_9BACT|nr:mechanosensitive ion channel domain-containing protein [Rubripirellula lacrimiformis]QDT07738.1 Mechanosensitive channel MscK precursor [Rubripirellula lacrimiformis]
MAWCLAWIVAVGLTLTMPATARAQVVRSDADAAVVPSAGEITPAKIKDLQSQIDSATDIEDDVRTRLTGLLSQASDELSRAAKLEAAAQQDQALVESVQTRLQTTLNEIKAITDSQPASPSESATMPELESSLAKKMADAQQTKNRLSALQADITRRSDRRKQISLLQASHAERLAETEAQLNITPPSGESNWSASARTILQQAKMQALAAEPLAYQWELAKYDAEQAVDLPTQKVREAQAEVARNEAELEKLNQRIDQLRKSQAQSRVTDLRVAAGQIDDPVLQQQAIRNVELAEENQDVVKDIGIASARTDAVKQRLTTLATQEERTRQRVARVGLSGAIGLELRKQLSSLPNTRDIERQGSQRQEIMRKVELSRLQYEDDLTDLSKEKPNPNATEIETGIQADHEATLQSLGKNYDKYFQQLSDLDFSENQLIAATDSYRSFLNEHVLWIRSNGFFGWTDLREAAEQFRDLLLPSLWADVGRSLWIDVFSQPWLYGLGLLALLLLMPARYRGRNQLLAFGKSAERPTCTEFSITIRAALMTVTMAVAWPAVLMFLGWRLAASPLNTTFPVAVGRALIATGGVLTLLNVVRHSCREMGLAVAHFGWPKRAVELLKRRTRQLRFLFLPFVFLVVLLRELSAINANNALERLALSASLVILSWALLKILHPRRGILAEYLSRMPTAWITRTSNLWSWTIIGFPMLMAILILFGFYYTASELVWRFWHTMWLAVSLVALRAFVIRALQINHRKIRIQTIKDRRAQQIAAQTPGATPVVEQAVTGEALTLENEHDALRANSEQVLRILHSGLLMTGLLLMWFLWSGLFPAFGILDQVEFWNTERDIVVEIPADDGSMTRTTELRVVPVTLINLIAAALIGLVTFTLVRNVPGLIEIVILQKLPLEASFKFAIVTMCRYAILVVGLLLAFSAVGASWSKLQWLVAALTVGLGFGLQEIFGNFVSGIIILWERPIRIGDVVTLDAVSGTVSRIQMRATTISDWDRKEYIVPNKDFVTGRLLNWTRSDQVSRIVVHIGVAYGSNVRQAIDLLLAAANHHPRVMDDPAPSSTFDGFGDSTLNLSLRCFVPNLEGRLDVISEINLAIDDTFKQAGIEIAFPQTDLHIRSVPAEWTVSSGPQPSAPATVTTRERTDASNYPVGEEIRAGSKSLSNE